MPDWSYATLSRPLLRRLDHDRGRRFVNGFFRLLGRLPQGFRLVDLLGHMHPAEELAVQLVNGDKLCSPVILAPCIDPRGDAVAALSRFGAGALVLGPVAVDEGARAGEPAFRQGADGSIVGSRGAALSLAEARGVVDQTGAARLIFELDPWAAEEPARAVAQLVESLADQACALVLAAQGYARLSELDEARQGQLLQALATACREQGVSGFVALPLTVAPDEALRWARHCQRLGLSLALSGRAHQQQQWRWGGEDAHGLAVELLAAIRGELADLCVWVDARTLAPRDAVELSDSGASLIGVGAGLVHTGPGLIKRINEALHYFTAQDGGGAHGGVVPDSEPAFRRPWLWGLLLGGSMLFGSVLAGWSALTTVLLPYDEEFLGRSVAEIAAFNPRVLQFMTHDRITLAGTMVSIGVLYSVLSVWVMRRGAEWAQHVVMVSAALGSLSFFAFLGFGYLDPFHAFVTTVLLQFLIQVAVRKMGPKQPPRVCPRLDNDAVWRRGLWGQLLFVVHAVSLLLAGSTILAFGMSVVFVPQDIAYLGCDAHSIHAFDAQLQSLIAHDRATFGGMLLSAGAALLLTSMWSFRHGDRWLFWTLALVMFAPYAMTLWIHWDIGYRDHFHLAPVYIGLGLLALSLLLSRRYLLARTHSG